MIAGTVTAAPLFPFLKERGITEEQTEAVEIGLFLEEGDGPMAQGALTLLPVAVVLEALEAIDDHPWKDTSPREFREYLQAEVKATGIAYWIAGAGRLPLEPQEEDDDTFPASCPACGNIMGLCICEPPPSPPQA